MTRTLIWLSAILAMLPGCSGPAESPRFVPSTAESAKSTPADGPGPSRQAEPPTKIPMH